MNKTKLLLIVFLLPSCGLWKKYVDKPDPPMCRLGITSVEPKRDLTRVLVYGDGLPGGHTIEVAKRARKTCDALGGCHFGIYLGDVYLTGANTEKELAEKVLTPLSEFNFHSYMVLGNHEYYGTPQAYYDLLLKHKKARLPCNQYFISDESSYEIQVIDTNWPTQASQPKQIKKLCDAKGFKIVAGHHPLWSSGKKKRSAEEKKTRSHFEKQMKQCADVYLAGHDHHQELIINEGFVQVVQGGFGKSLRNIIKGTSGQKFVAKKFGFSLLEIPASGVPEISFYDIKGIFLFGHEFY